MDNRVRLRDVLSAWAEGVMKVKGGQIPVGTRVVGTSSARTNLDIDAPLKTLRPLLPVKDGGLTVSIFWPEEKVPEGGLSTSIVPPARSTGEEAQLTLTAQNLARHTHLTMLRGPLVQVADALEQTTRFAADWAVPPKDRCLAEAKNRGADTGFFDRGRKQVSPKKMLKKRADANGNGVDKEELAKLVQKLREREANKNADNVATKAKKAKKRHREDAKAKAMNKHRSVSSGSCSSGSSSSSDDS